MSNNNYNEVTNEGNNDNEVTISDYKIQDQIDTINSAIKKNSNDQNIEIMKMQRDLLIDRLSNQENTLIYKTENSKFKGFGYYFIILVLVCVVIGLIFLFKYAINYTNDRIESIELIKLKDKYIDNYGNYKEPPYYFINKI
jgi:hypothetical protein